MMDTFYDRGGIFFDSADSVESGVSETILGEWLQGKPRNNLVIATKVREAMGDDPTMFV